MTAAEQAALKLIYDAGISVEEWEKRIRTGYRGKPYAVANTNYHKALVLLRKAGAGGNPNPTPIPTPPPANQLLAPYRSILFMGQNPLDALQAPSYYKVAFTADPAYDSYATRSAADHLRAAGHEVYVWYVPTEVSGQRAQEISVRLNATRIIGQCETTEQFSASILNGCVAMVGNLSALGPNQLAEVAAGHRIVINELYRNCQPNQQPDWKSANAGIPGNCVAVYGDGQCSRMTLAQYLADEMFVAHRDSVYGPGMTTADWQALP